VTSTVGKYATELAVINCPECGIENEIVAEDFADWSCNGCGYEPDWSDHGNGEDEVYRCIWCGDSDTIVSLCKSCTREAQERAKLRRKQCCPHCDERISADDLREINQARREVKEKLADVREKSDEGDA